MYMNFQNRQTEIHTHAHTHLSYYHFRHLPLILTQIINDILYVYLTVPLTSLTKRKAFDSFSVSFFLSFF